MLFFVDNRGTVISGKPSPVYQGAADTNNIVLVAPYAANLQFAVAFTLPNGVNTRPYVMTRGGAVNGVEFAPTGTGMAVWTFSMPSEITAHSGTVYAQFYAYGTNGQITPTSRISFSVAKGVEADLPDTPDQNIYNQILTALSQLTSQLNDGAYAARAIYWWIDTFTYGMNEVTFYPVGTYGAFVRSIAENNTGNQPYDDDSALDSAHWQELVNFNKIYAAEQNASAAAEAAATSATAAAASAKQAGDSATAAEQSVQKAAVNAQSSAASAESAEASANGAATSAQNAAASAKSAQESATKAEQSAGAAAEVSITLFDINFDDIDSDEGVVLPPEINEKRLTNPANLVIRCVPPSDLSSSSSIIMLYPNTGRSSLSVYWGNIVEDNYGLYRIAIGFLTDGHCYIVHNEYILPAMNPQTDKGKALVVGDEYYALEERIAPLAVSNVAKAYVSQENTGDTIGVEISQQTKAYTIAQRDGSGNLKTNTPSFADDVAPKSYVDAETERSKEQEQAIAQQVETLSQNINNSLSQKQNITDNTLETTAKTIPAAINENKQAIDGLRNDMTAQNHFKGFADTAADVQKINGDLNDFVYCIGTGTIWTYGASGWADSGKPYPSDATPLGTTTPLMDGTGAAGTSASAARSDHVHPTDTSRAAATALQAEVEERTAADTTLQNNLNAETTRAQAAEQANATAAASAQTTANGKYTKPASGIPATDLAPAVQESLEKANSALQSAPVTSVNNKTGAVSLTPEDVSAVPREEIPIPTAANNGKVLGIANGAYALVEQGANADAITFKVISTSVNENGGMLPSGWMNGIAAVKVFPIIVNPDNLDIYYFQGRQFDESDDTDYLHFARVEYNDAETVDVYVLRANAAGAYTCTKTTVGGGGSGQKYRHFLSCISSGAYFIQFIIENDSETPISTWSQLYNFFNQGGYTDKTRAYPARGIVGTEATAYVFGLYFYQGSINLAYTDITNYSLLSAGLSSVSESGQPTPATMSLNGGELMPELHDEVIKILQA